MKDQFAYFVRHFACAMRYGKASADNVCYVIAKYDYEAQENQELSLRKNERYLLLDDSKPWWKVQNAKSQSGYVPSNYVKKEKPSIFDSFKKKVKKTGGGATLTAATIGSNNMNSSAYGGANNNNNNDHSKSLPLGGSGAGLAAKGTTDSPAFARRTLPEPAEAIGSAIVKYNYQAKQQDELSLVKGTRILILEKSNDGWWRGQNGASIGWFPSNYTNEECDNSEDTLHTYAMAENVLDIVVALYAFKSSNEQELSFEKGDRLEIVDRPANDPEWYRARNSAGAVGLVPRNYLQEISECLSGMFIERRPSIAAATAATTATATTTTAAVAIENNNSKDGALPLPPHGTATPAPVAVTAHLVGKPWYYGNISRSQCDNILNQHGHDGDFLIRDSETNTGDYSVSLKAPGRNKHFRVHVDGAQYCIGQRKFHNLDQLVDHYQRAPIYTNRQGEKLYLVRSLPKCGSNGF